MRCNARMAFVLLAVSARNQWLHADLNRRPVSKLAQHGPANKPPPPLKGGAVLQLRRNAVAEPNKQEIEARAYKLWEEAGRPKDREAEFWHLAEQELRNEDKASPIRTPDTL